MGKKKHREPSPSNVPMHIWMAKDALNEAFYQDEKLQKFTVELEDGHKLTMEELHHWINAAAQHYEQNAPREVALKAVNELLEKQNRSYQ